MVVVMADVDITSLSVEISAESQGAELNIDKLTTAISNLRTKGSVTKVVNSLDKLAGSIATLKQASAGMSGRRYLDALNSAEKNQKKDRKQENIMRAPLF